MEIQAVAGKKSIFQRTIAVHNNQAEKLLPTLETELKKKKLTLKDIVTIQVVNEGTGFTNLRLGIITANALAYALNIPVLPTRGKVLHKRTISVVQPVYDKPPTITTKKI